MKLMKLCVLVLPLLYYVSAGWLQAWLFVLVVWYGCGLFGQKIRQNILQ